EKKLEVAGDLVRLPGRGVVLKDEEAESKKTIEQAFSSAGLQVPALYNVLAGLKVDKARAQKIVTLLLRDKVLVKISDELVFHHRGTGINAIKHKIHEGSSFHALLGRDVCELAIRLLPGATLFHQKHQEVPYMARIRGAEPSQQGTFGGLLTRIVYALTKRKLGRVVMPVQVTAHHPQILWGYGQ